MTVEQKIIKNKLELLNLAKTLGNVSEACKVMGYSRDSFYRFKELYDEGGDEALKEITRKKANLKNRIDPVIEEAVLTMSFEYPAFGQVRICNELKKNGVFVSPGGVRCIWLRNNLENFKKRLKALEAKVAKENFILTEAQVQALEKAKEEKYETGEIETEHPGYLGSQDTFYVGTIKGVGRIYQQTFIDTYSKNAIVKLYDRKKIYSSIEELQKDADEWIYNYNYERPHSGKKCEGRTPMQTFKESIHIAKEKMFGYDIKTS